MNLDLLSILLLQNCHLLLETRKRLREYHQYGSILCRAQGKDVIHGAIKAFAYAHQMLQSKVNGCIIMTISRSDVTTV